MADLEKKHRKTMAQKTRRESVAASFSPAASAKAPKLRCPDAKAGSNQWLNGNHQNPRGKLMILMIFEVNLDITCFF